MNGKKDRTNSQFYDREEPSVVMLKMLERALRRCDFDKDSERSEEKIVYRRKARKTKGHIYRNTLKIMKDRLGPFDNEYDVDLILWHTDLVETVREAVNEYNEHNPKHKLAPVLPKDSDYYLNNNYQNDDSEPWCWDSKEYVKVARVDSSESDLESSFCCESCFRNQKAKLCLNESVFNISMESQEAGQLRQNLRTLRRFIGFSY